MWIKITERLPEEDKRYLVMYKGYVCILSFNSFHKCWDDEEGDDYECDIEAVTHWQEITPPKD